jgi:8-oxo-dGTP pyrophosphatase MutT (NUDIX family)
VTVATVVERANRYLLVEERDKTTGELVFNQPAGHLESGESLPAAALRETLEETGWEVELTGVLGIALYTAPANGITYHRTTFLATPLRPVENARLDPDIYRVHWLDYEEILANSARMRSPLVLASIERQRQGQGYPLEFCYYA